MSSVTLTSTLGGRACKNESTRSKSSDSPKMSRIPNWRAKRRWATTSSISATSFKRVKNTQKLRCLAGIEEGEERHVHEPAEERREQRDHDQQQDEVDDERFEAPEDDDNREHERDDALDLAEQIAIDDERQRSENQRPEQRNVEQPKRGNAELPLSERRARGLGQPTRAPASRPTQMRMAIAAKTYSGLIRSRVTLMDLAS